MNSTDKGVSMKQNMIGISEPLKEKNADDLSLIKLHATLSFLMTRFYNDQCPKLAHFIVMHIRMIAEHPGVVDSPECKTIYQQLLQEWQKITDVLLEQRLNLVTEIKHIH
jgi:hypothetical protein